VGHQADRQAGTKAGRQVGRQTNRPAYGWTEEQADRQKGRGVEGWICRQTERQAYKNMQTDSEAFVRVFHIFALNQYTVHGSERMINI
jgi:hypothetical protein